MGTETSVTPGAANLGPSRRGEVRPVGQGKEIVVLDALRGLAAFYVLLFHAAYWLHRDGALLKEPGGPMRLIADGNPLGLFGFGHYAVIVFFVLSGFVIHLRQAQKPEERRRLGAAAWLRRFAWRRAIRIYPPLLFALLVTFVVGWVGGRAMGDFFGHPVADRGGARLVLNDNLDSVVALFNLVPVGYIFGSNEALWSIHYEIWFYVAYVPLLLVLLDKMRWSIWTAFAVFSAAGAVATALWTQTDLLPHRVAGFETSFPLNLVAYFPIWLVGAVLAELYAKGAVLRHRAAVATAAVTLVALLVARGEGPVQVVTDYAWTAVIALLFAVLLLTPDRALTANRPVQLLAISAGWSYSLYAVHMPVLMAVRGLAGADLPAGPGLALLGIGAGLAAGIVAWLLVERPSAALARWRPGPARASAPRYGTGIP